MIVIPHEDSAVTLGELGRRLDELPRDRARRAGRRELRP